MKGSIDVFDVPRERPAASTYPMSLKHENDKTKWQCQEKFGESLPRWWNRKRLCTGTPSRPEPVIGFITCPRLLSVSFSRSRSSVLHVSVDTGRAASSKRKMSRASSEFPRFEHSFSTVEIVEIGSKWELRCINIFRQPESSMC